MTEPNYYSQSYPPSLWGGGGGPVVQPQIATEGQPGAYLPEGSATPASEAAFLALGLIAQPLSVWSALSWVQCMDGARMGWTGSQWANVAGVPGDDEEAQGEEEEAPEYDEEG